MVGINILKSFKESIQKELNILEDSAYLDCSINVILLKTLENLEVLYLNDCDHYETLVEGETPADTNIAQYEFTDTSENTSYIVGGAHIGVSEYVESDEALYLTAKHITTGVKNPAVTWDHITGQIGGYAFYSKATGKLIIVDIAALNNSMLNNEVLTINLLNKSFPYLLEMTR
jgi:hypothetical protein